MMTAESSTVPGGEQRPEGKPAGHGSGGSKPSMRFAAKIARRELARRRGRAILITALIAIPTCIMLTVAVYNRTSMAAEQNTPTDYASDLVIPFVVNDPGDGKTAYDRRSANAYARYGQGEVELTQTEVEALLPPGSTVQRVLGDYTSVMDGDGKITTADFVIIDLTTDAAAPWAPLSDGRVAQPGEVVLGGELAKQLGVGVGDTLTLRQPEGSWRVAGIAHWSYDLLAMPDFDESRIDAPYGDLLVDLPDGTTADEADQLSRQLTGWIPNRSRFSVPPVGDYYGDEGVAITWLAGVLLFVMFGVVIVAAFATVARGQLVTVGQLAANGARQRFASRVLALQGFWTGIAGVTIGSFIAVGVVMILRRSILLSFWQPVDHIVWSPLDVVVIGLIGVTASTVAAALPAVSLVKTSVLDALAGRRADRPVPKWMVPVGIGSFAIGLLLMVLSVRTVSNWATAAAMIGALAMAIGVCLIGPLAVDLASKAGRAVPSLSLRMSLRGLGRARLRSAAVVSAIAVTTGVISVITAGAETATLGPNAGDTADNVAIVASFPSLEIRTPQGDALIDEQGAALPDVPDEVKAVALRWISADAAAQVVEARRILPDATEHPLRVAVRPDGVYDNSDGAFFRTPSMGEEVDMEQMYGYAYAAGDAIAETYSLPIVADETTLDGLSLPGTFQRDLNIAGFGTAVPSGNNCNYLNESPVLWDGGPVEAPQDAALIAEPLQSVHIPVRGLACYSEVGPFMTEEFALAHGYQIEPAGAVVVNPDPLTDEQRAEFDGDDYVYPSIFTDWQPAGADETVRPAAVSSVSATPSIYLATVYERPLNADAFRLFQLAFFVAAFLFVTLIVALGLALAAADSQRDRAVLSIVGAAPSTLRQIAATDAWVLAVIGTALGVPAALFAAWVVTTAAGESTPTGVPWLFVGLEFVVLPILVAVVAWMVGLVRRSTPPMRVLHTD